MQVACPLCENVLLFLNIAGREPDCTLEDQSNRLPRHIPMRKMSAVLKPMQLGAGEKIQGSLRLARQTDAVLTSHPITIGPRVEPNGAPSCVGP